ncbi:MAG TPA: c-type cytochrome domain-containing protein [Opitutaceae bacterium]|nr:c-type cytochrome domain-containing protein [Opitutaceae bacterium]
MKLSFAVIVRLTGLSLALMALTCRADNDPLVYTGIVKPIMASACVSCHGEKKQKKRLRLDSLAAIMKGGRDGAVVVPGKVDKSDLIDRIELDLKDEDHMPPIAKPQLSHRQILILKWWVASGAPGDVPLSSVKMPDDVKAAIGSR